MFPISYTNSPRHTVFKEPRRLTTAAIASRPASNLTRILKPDFEKKSWTVVAPYAEPSAAAADAAPAVAKPTEAE